MSPYACVHGRAWFLEFMHLTMGLPVHVGMIQDAVRYDSLECVQFYLRHVGERFAQVCAASGGFVNFGDSGLHCRPGLHCGSNVQVISAVFDVRPGSQDSQLLPC